VARLKDAARYFQAIPRGGKPGVDAQMEERFHNLLLGCSVIERTLHVLAELAGTS
jgi:hypothetical protein